MSATMGFSAARVWLIARNTLLEAIRQRLFNFLLVLAIALVASSLFFREFNFGSSELKFISDFGFGALTFFGSILAVAASAQLFFSEIENRTALTILAKPVHRSEFILGKFGGVWLVLLAFTLLVAAAMALVLFGRETVLQQREPEAFAAGRLVGYGSLLLVAALQWLKFGLISALTILVASFSNTNLYTVVMGFFVVVVCHLQYLARDAWDRLGNWFAKLGAAALAFFFPNFQLFNLGDLIALGQPAPLRVLGSVAAYGVVYLAAILAVAVFLFRRREI